MAATVLSRGGSEAEPLYSWKIHLHRTSHRTSHRAEKSYPMPSQPNFLLK